DMVMVGTTDGEVIALGQGNGEVLWRSQLTGEVLAAPQTNGRVVAVQTYDGKLHGLNADDGEAQWQYDSNVPVLTLRGTSAPMFHEGVLIGGFGNGKLAAFDDNGTLRWETRVALAQGRSEIERLVDIDGNLMVIGSTVYAVSYQGKLSAVDIPSGRIMWQQDASSYVGLDQGFGNIYVSDQQGALMAYYKSGQGLRWEQSLLERRVLSRPTALRSYVAVSDFEGYVHLISQVDGHFVGRTRVDSSGVRADMIAEGNMLYVFDNSGVLTAFRVASLGN
ncbi:MAG: outer membrane protein assembly factor BamB, partial [Halieaceae bacterium]